LHKVWINSKSFIHIKNISMNFKKYYKPNKTKYSKNNMIYIQLDTNKDFKCHMEVSALEDKIILSKSHLKRKDSSNYLYLFRIF